MRDSLRRVAPVVRDRRRYRTVLLFLAAYFFYIDGVGTIIKLATAYGTDLGLSADTLLVVLLVVQVVAFPCALLYDHLARTRAASISMLVASSQGGIQALSRSYSGQLIPATASAEFFGFYNMFGKFAAILGPLLVGVFAQLTGDTSTGVLSIALLFAVGGVLLLRVPPHPTGVTPAGDAATVAPAG